MSKLTVNEAYCKLLIHNQLVTEEQARENLAIASKLRNMGVTIPLSDLLVERGVIALKTASAIRKLVEQNLHTQLDSSPVRELGATSDEDEQLGQLLMHNALISYDDLEAAMAAKTELAEDGVNLLLAEVLVGRGLVHLPIMESMLELHRAKTESAGANGDRALKEQDLQFGQLAIENKLVGPEAVLDALVLQRELHEEMGFSQRLGAILLAKEVMAEDEVRMLLELQAAARGDDSAEQLDIFMLPPNATERKLGEILETHKLVPQEVIEECLHLQEYLADMGLKRRLGELLLMQGHLDPEHLASLLKVQKSTRKRVRKDVEEKVREKVKKRTTSKGRTTGKGKRGFREPKKPASKKLLLASLGMIAVCVLTLGGVIVFGGHDPKKPDKNNGKKTVENGTTGTSKTSGTTGTTATDTKGAEHARLKESIDLTEEEMDMDPRLAEQVLKDTRTAVKKAGFGDLVTRCDELLVKLAGQMEAYQADEYRSRESDIKVLIGKDRLLDAMQVYADLVNYFGSNVPKSIAKDMTALGGKLDHLEKQAIGAFTSKIDKALKEGDWKTASDTMETLSFFGDSGFKLSKTYETKLRDRKRTYFQERLSAVRAERRKESVTRYNAARQKVIQMKTELARELAARSALAQKRTESSPIREIKLRDKRTRFTGCRIKRVDETGVVISGRSNMKQLDEKKIDFTHMQIDSRILVTRLTLTGKEALPYLELAKTAIHWKRFDDAEKDFKRAAEIDPKLKGKLPNVDDYRKQPTFSSGKETKKGGRITIHFGFDKKSELEDWGRESASLKLEGGQMKFSARRILRGEDYGLQAPMNLKFVPGDAAPGGYLLIQLSYRVGRRLDGFYLMLNDKYDRYAIGDGPYGYFMARFTLLTGRLKFEPCRANEPVKVVVTKDKLEMFIGKDSIKTVESKVSDVSVTLTGASRNRDAMFGMNEMTFEGKLSADKYKRAIDEKLAWKLRGLQSIGATGGAQRGDEAFGLPHIDPEHIERIEHKDMPRWRQFIAAIKDFAKRPDFSNRAAVRTTAQLFSERNNESAAFYFYRGWFRTWMGEFPDALLDYSKATTIDPEFAEAFGYQGRLLILKNDETAAATSIAKAIELKPDFAYARMLEAKLAFYSMTDFASGQRSIQMMETASALAPKSREIKEELSQIKNIIKGPPWPHGRPAPIESAHFILHTDLPAALAKEMLGTMEKVYKAFSEFQPDTPKRKKGHAFLFATKASYLIYKELTLGDGGDNSLGYYHPGFKHLHVFVNPEDDDRKTKVETIDTMQHEAFHQFINPIIPSIPRWLNEGLAQYFGTATFDKDGKVKFGLQKRRLKIIADVMKNGNEMSLEELMGTSAPQFMGYWPGYPHAWAIVHLCMVHSPSKYKKAFMAYLEGLRNNKSRELTYQETFGKMIDIKVMSRDLKAMVKELRATLKDDE